MSYLMKPALILFAMLALTACETVQGAGQDIQKAGGSIEKTAEDAEG